MRSCRISSGSSIWPALDLNNEISKSERSDERIAELNTKVNDLYGKIMADEGMTAYNEAKRDCENLVNYIDAIINTAMNGGDPMTVQEPSEILHRQLLHLRRLPLTGKMRTRLQIAGRVFLPFAVTYCKPTERSKAA